jgi:hypothetical protein
MRRSFFQSVLVVLAEFVLAPAGSAAVVEFDRPAMDVWMYENGYDRGFRENAPTFAGPIAAANGSDDRLAQMIMGWNTAGAGIPAGLAPAQYAITRVTLRMTQINDDLTTYDPTYDSYRTYRAPSDAAYLPDVDAGRPLELYGVGLRNGYTQLAVSGAVSGTRFGEETMSFSSGVGEHRRHAFASAPSSPRADRDVSENVSEGFDPVPFAIGITNEIAAGELVPADTEFTFELNLADSGILAYVQSALSSGQLGLTLSTLHPSSYSGAPGAQTYPRFYTRDYYDYVDHVVPQLEIEYALVPEPSSGQILILVASFLVTARAWRRREYYS